MKKNEPKITIVTRKNGRKYAYRAVEHRWNAEKKSCETKLEYYGTVDDEGNVLPKRMKLVKAAVVESGDDDLHLLSSKRIGLTRAMWRIAEEIGLAECLKAVFPQTWRTILSLAMYHASTGSNAAYLFPEWHESHELPIHDDDLSSQDISRLYSGMDEARRKEFLLGWRKKAATGNACFHDITSISSYSKDNELIEYGYNRDGEDLPQVNLGMIVDSGNRLPIYYRVHDGSIPDVSTLQSVLREGYSFNYSRLTFVMDKGFFSSSNVSAMYGHGYHFIMAMTLASAKTRDAMDEVNGRIRHPRNIIRTDSGQLLYAMGVKSHWNAEGMHRECMIHVYAQSVADINLRTSSLDIKLAECCQELNAGKFLNSHAALYARYFTEVQDPDGNRRYEYNDEHIKERETKYAGLFAIVTDRMDLSSTDVMNIYRDKDGVEKIFNDIKNVQDCRRLSVHTRQAMDGRVFVVFIASILMAEIRQRLRDCKDRDEMTMDLVRKTLDKVSVSYVKRDGKRKHVQLYSDLTGKQTLLLSSLLKVKPADVEKILKEILV